MDRRQQRTRQAILQAISDLLKEKDYEHISVMDIVERANIGRSTFYAHFETKEDLLRAMCTELFGHVFSKDLLSERHHDFSQVHGQRYSVITHLLYHIQENRGNILEVLNRAGSETFLQYFRKDLDELFRIRFFKDVDLERLPMPEDYLLSHMTGSLIHTIQWWIKGGLRESPEVLTEYLKTVIEPVLQPYRHP